MKTMKTKTMIVAIAFIILASGISASQPITDDGPNLKVSVEVKNLLTTRRLILATVTNLENEQITLSVDKPAGGILISTISWVFEIPGFVPLFRTQPYLFLKPGQKRIIAFAIWNMKWNVPLSILPMTAQFSLIAYGYLGSYEYKGNTYPMILSGPVVFT